MRDLNLLDKDLDRLSNAESAGLHVARPLVRLGLAVIIAAVAMALALPGQGHALSGIVIAGTVAAMFLGLAIGANDVANSLSPAVGSGALPMGVGLLLVAVMEIAGALLAGDRVSSTLTVGIVAPGQMLSGTAPALVMLSAMLAAGAWITLATWAGAPVSTTHAVVGGIAGAGASVFGMDAVAWPTVARIAAAWVATPILSALLAAAILAVLRAKVYRAPDRIAAARVWLPGIVALMVAVLAAYAGAQLRAAPWPLAGMALLAALLSGWTARRWLARPLDPGDKGGKQLARLFGVPLTACAMLMSFGHGANDASNVVAPLAILAQSTRQLGTAAAISPWVSLAAGIAIAAGAVLFGRRLVRMVGSRITRLSPVRALCVSLATALIVLGASWLGLPVSTTHIAVGGVFGVGFYREWEEWRHRRTLPEMPVEERLRRRLVRRGQVVRTLAAWVVTLPAAALLAALTARLIG